MLDAIHALAAHEFWDEGFSYRAIDPTTLTGWAQVTDAWLAELARRKQARLATLDVALATRHADVAFLVPV